MRVFLDSIGCRLNQSEIEKYASDFSARGHQLVGSLIDADIAILNTCAVTAAATSDSRQRIHRLLNRAGLQVIATGCLAELKADDLRQLSDHLIIIPNLDKDHLVDQVLGNSSTVNLTVRTPVPGQRRRTRAFIKAQDGCDNHCTYCVTRLARGASRSISISDVCTDVKLALAGGVKEIILTGVQLGSWGNDLSSRLHLKDLILAVLQIQGEFRIRLSSVEPWDLMPDFFELWLTDTRLCRHFHLPLQSGSGATLKRMARNSTPSTYKELIQQIRNILPDVTISTDIIVGFPGETNNDFEESLYFVRSMNFQSGHVFHFSPGDGTAAARLPMPVPLSEMKRRSKLMQAEFDISSARLREKKLGRNEMVLWEGLKKTSDGGWLVAGLTQDNYRVRTHTITDISNRFLETRLDGKTEDGFWGSVLMPEMPGEH